MTEFEPDSSTSPSASSEPAGAAGRRSAPSCAASCSPPPARPPTRPRRLRLLIAAYAVSGAVLLAVVAVGVAGAGPLAA